MNPEFPGTCISLTWRNANNASIPLGCGEYSEGVKKTRDSKKGLHRVLISKETFERGPAARLRLCLRCAVSWKGVARLSSIKEKNLGESIRAKNWLFLINH